MKRTITSILAIMLALIMVMSLAACGSSEKDTKDTSKDQLVDAIQIDYYIVKSNLSKDDSENKRYDIKYEYDEDGLITKILRSHESDSNGNVFHYEDEMDLIYKDGKLADYKYTERCLENKTESESHIYKVTPDGKIDLESSEHEFEYDSNGLVLKATTNKGAVTDSFVYDKEIITRTRNGNFCGEYYFSKVQVPKKSYEIDTNIINSILIRF